MKKLYVLIGAILILLLGSPAFATLIRVNDVVGSWQNAVPPAAATIVNGDPTSVASWGGVSQPSNYTFNSDVPPPVEIYVPPSPSGWVNFGDFTHNNFPIPSGTAITSIDLSLFVAMGVDGSPVNVNFVYTFNHNETPNTGNPEESRDIVTITPPTSGAFMIGSVFYTMELRFSTDGGLTQVNEFKTYESASNTAALYGRFTSENVPVPEPATMLLLASGLVGLAAFRRRFN